MNLVSAEACAAEVLRRLHATKRLFNVFWISVEGDRDVYKRTLDVLLESEPVYSVVVRRRIFFDANLIGQDIADILKDNAESILSHQCLSVVSRDRPFGLVLVGRSCSAGPQASSPIHLPSWFPVEGGNETHVAVEDLSWSTMGSIACAEAEIDQLSALLFEVDGALLDRLRRAHAVDHRLADGLMSAIAADGETPKLTELVKEAEGYRRTVTAPENWRPSLRNQRSLVCRLWSRQRTSPPEATYRLANQLAKALNLGDEVSDAHESFAAVINRPSNPIPVSPARFVYACVTTISAAAQLITAAAHSDEYRQYPVNLLQAMSVDLRRALSDAVDYLTQ